jgi:predicted RNA-binding Zn-ribbon protein involved in translation (DUF1610 family)
MIFGMARLLDGLAVLLLAALLVYAVRIYWHVSKPRRYKCPQCGGARHVSPTKALVKLKCPYCGGVGEVWR